MTKYWVKIYNDFRKSNCYSLEDTEIPQRTPNKMFAFDDFMDYIVTYRAFERKKSPIVKIIKSSKYGFTVVALIELYMNKFELVRMTQNGVTKCEFTMLEYECAKAKFKL